MRTGARGIFPAYYAHEVVGQTKDLMSKYFNNMFLKYDFFFPVLMVKSYKNKILSVLHDYIFTFYNMIVF